MPHEVLGKYQEHGHRRWACEDVHEDVVAQVADAACRPSPGVSIVETEAAARAIYASGLQLAGAVTRRESDRTETEESEMPSTLQPRLSTRKKQKIRRKTRRSNLTRRTSPRGSKVFGLGMRSISKRLVKKTSQIYRFSYS